MLAKWGLTLDELRDGSAEHDRTPAEISVLAARENNRNVVSGLVEMEIAQKLITVGQRWNGDLEFRLLQPMSYGANQQDQCRWYGYAANSVGKSYQDVLDESRGLTFEQTFLKSTDNQGNWREFQRIYEKYAKIMNFYLRPQIWYSPRPDSFGYYHDFEVTPDNQGVFVEAVQKFFELMGSPLADKELFSKSGTPSIINYDAPEKFCQCQ
ncbi:MAG: hypothetical protein WA064_02790 [Candidatus Moraniibacteriota bacterium]